MTAEEPLKQDACILPYLGSQCYLVPGIRKVDKMFCIGLVRGAVLAVDGLERKTS